MFRSRRITIYVLKELLVPTGLALGFFVFLLMMNRFFWVAEKALAKNLGFDLTLRLFVVGIPRLLLLAIPMSVLLGTLIGLGRLSADHEWVAIQAAGRGPMALFRAVVVHGLLGTLATFLVYSFVVPRTNYVIRSLRGEMIYATNLASDLKPREFYDLRDVVLFVDEIRPGRQRRLENVLSIQSDRESGNTTVILARDGDLYPAADESGTLLLELHDGILHVFNSEEPDIYRTNRGFQEIRQPIDPAPYLRQLLAPPKTAAQDLFLPELWEEFRVSRAEAARLRALRAEGKANRADVVVPDRRARTATIELNQRISLPLACLLFAVVALRPGLRWGRFGKGAGFAVSLVLIAVYWLTFTLGKNQAYLGNVPAEIGPWIGDAVIFVLALWGLWRIRYRAAVSGPGITGTVRALVAGFLDRVLRWRRSKQVLPAPDEARGELPLSSEDPEAEMVAGLFSGLFGRWRIDLYVASQYVRLLLLALAGTYLIFLMVETKSLTEDLLRTDQSPNLVLEYFSYFWPRILGYTLPISCLVAGVVTFTLLARSGELVAIQGCGISARRATYSIIGLTVVVCVALFLVEDRISPGANRMADEIRDRIAGKAPRTHGPPLHGSWSFGPDGRRLYNYRLYNPEAGVFQGFSVFTIDRAGPSILEHRFAREARWDGVDWELDGTWSRSFPADGSIGDYVVSDGPIRLDLDPPAGEAGLALGAMARLPEQMSLSDIEDQIGELRSRGYDVTHLMMAWHGKIAQAFTPLVMVLLGLPFGFRVGRRGPLYGIGVAFLLVLVYWAVMAMFNALGLQTLAQPIVAAWAPNLLFSLLGATLMVYQKS